MADSKSWTYPSAAWHGLVRKAAGLADAVRPVCSSARAAMREYHGLGASPTEIDGLPIPEATHPR